MQIPYIQLLVWKQPTEEIMLELTKKEGEDLLHLACKNGQVTLIKNLLKAKVDINAFNFEGLSALHWAVIKGNVEVTRLLIREGANIEIKDSKWGSTPLLFACQNGKTKIVKLLFENGADIDAENDEGTSAIHFAAQSGKIDLVDILLQKGLDINSKNNLEENPLHYTLYPRHFPACQKATNSFGMAKFLIENGAKIDEDSSRGTPLTCAVATRNLDVVKLLIAQGAKVNHVTNTDLTPLPLALLYCNNEILKFLIENGAEVNAVHMTHKRTPLHASAYHFSCITKRCEITRILLENGANPKLRDVDGFTPFDIALEEGNNQFVKMALESCPYLIADLNATGNFPIQYALEQYNLSAFKMIITHCQK